MHNGDMRHEGSPPSSCEDRRERQQFANSIARHEERRGRTEHREHQPTDSWNICRREADLDETLGMVASTSHDSASIVALRVSKSAVHSYDDKGVASIIKPALTDVQPGAPSRHQLSDGLSVAALAEKRAHSDILSDNYKRMVRPH
jgi:hypothetical protein